MRDTKLLENNLIELAELGGGACQAAINLKKNLAERFTVLKAALTLLTA
jgi:hypothetical protein